MKYIKGYDGLRAISIIMVLVTHLGWLDAVNLNSYFGERLLKVCSGFTGVCIFFTLSGFLITRLLIEEKYSKGRINVFHFFFRRFLRLLPPLLLFFCVVAILMAFHLINESWPGLLMALFYVYNFVPSKFYTSELGHIWSLAVEEQFYFIWPFIISFVTRTRVVLLALVIIGLCVLAQWWLPGLQVRWHGKMYVLGNVFRVRSWFLPAVAPIIVGALVSKLGNEHRKDSRLQRFFRDKRLSIAGVLLFLCPFYVPHVLLEYAYFIQAAGVAFILVWIKQRQDSVPVTILSWAPLAYTGKISYGLYVYHGLFMRTGLGGSLWVQQFPVNLLLTVLVAVLSYHYYEKPILRLKSRYK